MKLTLFAAALFAFAVPTFAYAEEAAEIWKAKCKGCHGEDGKAQTKIGQKEKIDDFTNVKWQEKETDEELRKAISDGSDSNSKMKPFKDKLTVQEIDSLVKYIRTMKGK